MINKLFEGAAIAVVSLGCVAGSAHADVTVRTRVSVDQASTESVLYSRDARQRIENGQTVLIQQFDQKRTIQLNVANKTYISMPFDDAERKNAANEPAAQARKGGSIEIETSVTDTGERKNMFGYEARHLKIETKQQASADACSPGKYRIEADGWYIDFKLPNQDSLTNIAQNSAARTCKDDVHSKANGEAQPGFPVESSIKTWNGDAADPLITKLAVTELSTAALDPALFEVPAGFSERTVSASTAGDRASSSQAFGARQTGITRVAVLPVNDKTGKKAVMAMASRQIAALLHAAAIDAAAFDSEPSAKQAQADYLLYTDVTEIKEPNNAAAQTLAKSGRFGGLVKGISKMTPVGAVASSAAGIIAGTPEARVEYRLVPVEGGAPVCGSVIGTAGSGFNMQTAFSMLPAGIGIGMMAKSMPGASALLNPALNSSAISGGGVAGLNPVMAMMAGAGGGNGTARISSISEAVSVAAGLMPGHGTGASATAGQSSDATSVLAAFSSEAKAVAEKVKR
ncbi:MAG: DUF4412 domain-containing protein [Acidobacteriaceae bacterium]|nr:DUF4412 domain-containing protein [Acidobacteriaceae bacterium]